MAEWPLGQVAPFAGARLAWLAMGRDFEDATLPQQRFAMLSPGLVAGARLRLLRRVHLVGRGRVHYLLYNVDEQRSLGYWELGAQLSFQPCVGPRAQADLGQDSQLYADTRRVSGDFNRGLDGLLSLLEGIRYTPPNERAPRRRQWGPAPHKTHPGHEVRFQMEREGERFDYRLQLRPARAGEEAWWTFLQGSFQAKAGIRKGEGEVHLFLAEAASRGFPVDELRGYGQLDIGYQTRTLPTRVELLLTSSGAAVPDVRYRYRELPGGFGEMGFVVRGKDMAPGAALEDVEMTNRWTPERGGVGTFVILSGDYVGASLLECWDVRGRTTFFKRSREQAGVGEAEACPDVSEFGR